MKVLSEGYTYELESLGGENPQTIQFYETQPSDLTISGKIEAIDGTTNEELLAVLIHRINYCQKRSSCKEYAIVITNLEECEMWLEKQRRSRTCIRLEETNKK